MVMSVAARKENAWQSRAWQPAALALSVLGLSIPRAQADGAVLASVTRDDQTLVADSEAARRAALGYFGQKAPAVRLFTPEGARPEPPPELRECKATACAGQLARAVSADFAVFIHVSAADGAARGGSVRASLVTPEGLVFEGASAFGPATGISSADIATARALSQADERHQRGPGPWLSVHAPDGAQVSVDGGPARPAPYLERQAPGSHRVVVRRPDGSSLFEGFATLADDPASYEEIDSSGLDGTGQNAALVAQSVDSRRDDSRYFERPRSRNNLYVGIPLTALGIALTAAGLSHYARRGDCADSACNEVHTVNALSRALVAGGATLAAGSGISFLALGVLREPERTPQGAMLHLQGRF